MKSNSGFTIAEILVIIPIIAILSSILILYNRSTEKQLILFKEQARLISTLNRAKGLALAFFREPSGEIACSYGVRIFPDPDSSYIIFKDLPNDPSVGCSSADNLYSGPNENFDKMVEVDKKAIEIDSDPAATTLINIVFLPPDPRVVLNGNPSLTADQKITLKLKDSNVSRVVKVNKAGQITAE